MNADRLLARYDRIADAPDAVPRLRRFILDLAVRGKLVEQDPNDEPASELLKRIAAEKARLVKAREIRNREVLPPIKIDEFLFGIPAKWCWVKLGNIIDYSPGRTPARNEPSFWNSGDHHWISIADINDGETLTTTRETVSEKSVKQVFRSDPAKIGTMIMSFKLTIGKIARLGIPAYHNEAIISMRPYFSDLDPYLFKVLPFFARQGDTKGAIKGATLNRESISNIPIPLPPLAEQHRIVAKVDELMGLCDRLEAARAEREATRDRLAAASLARLNAPDPETIQDHARFALDALPALTSRPDQIKQLRQTILNLAVRGKLVEQNPNDEPVSELLKRIAAEKARLVRAGKIRKRKELVILKETELPFKIPNNWKWVRLGELGVTQTGTTPSKNHNDHFGSHIPFIKPADLHPTHVDYSNEGLSEVGAEASGRLAGVGSILMVCIGTIGKCQLIDRDCSFNQQINAISPFGNLDSLYLLAACKSDFFQKAAWSASARTTIAILNKGNWEKLSFPLPPLADQHRIVAKVDELMAVCDQLEASLAARDQTRHRLLDALLHEALAA